MMTVSMDIPCVCMLAAVSVCGVTMMMMEARGDYRGRLVALGALGGFLLTLTIALTLTVAGSFAPIR
jgi:hypothetical protein